MHPEAKQGASHCLLSQIVSISDRLTSLKGLLKHLSCSGASKGIIGENLW